MGPQAASADAKGRLLRRGSRSQFRQRLSRRLWAVETEVVLVGHTLYRKQSAILRRKSTAQRKAQTRGEQVGRLCAVGQAAISQRPSPFLSCIDPLLVCERTIIAAVACQHRADSRSGW